MACQQCERIRMCLAEAGLDPDRVLCFASSGAGCVVGCGTGEEGLPVETVEMIVDKALALVTGGEG